MRNGRVVLLGFCLGLTFASRAWAAEKPTLEARLKALVRADDGEYLAARKDLLVATGAKAYLERACKGPANWTERVLAGACIAWSKHGDKIRALIADEKVARAFPDPKMPVRDLGRASEVAANTIMRRAKAMGLDDKSLVVFLTERLLKSYHTAEWQKAMKSFSSQVKDKTVKASIEAAIATEAQIWRLVAIEGLRRVGTPAQIKPLAATALRCPETQARIAALEALASLRDRRGRGKTRVGPKGEIKVGGAGVGGPPVQHEWEKVDIKFSTAHVQTIWQTMLLSMVLDPSPQVQKAAAEALELYAELECVPFLEKALELVKSEEVKKTARASLAGLKKLRAIEEKRGKEE